MKINKVNKKFVAYFKKFNYLGLVFAVIFFALSVAPSLLPRTAYIQGLVTGLSVASGYGIGVLISAVIRWLVQNEIPVKVKEYAWKALYVVGFVVLVAFTWLAKVWHNEVQALVGLPTNQSFHILNVWLIAIIVFVIILFISRLLGKLFNFTYIKIDHLLPKRLSILLSLIIISSLVFWVVSGVFATNFVNVANAYFGQRDTTVPEGYTQPTSPLRSGSAESLSSWDTIGYQGRKFVAGGPDKQKIEQVVGQATNEPVRVYVGLKAAETAQQRADIVVQEMERTGAFNRQAIILATTTGSGWLEPQAVDSVEYMYGGNTAIVSQQYSYLPSWISYLTDKETATEAGQALFDAVYGKWMQMPKDTRPKLYAYGLSLGSYGGQTPYSGVNDLRFSIDGALFVGTPNFTNLWRNTTNNRDKGSPEWLPVYDNGKAVRFAYDNESITKDTSTWQKPRILYVQHASDPVVWFDFSLIDTKPDWLKEPRGPDVSPATRWFPVVSFFQLGIDQISAGTVPYGHGHMYGNAVVNSWATVTDPPNWDTNKTKILQEYINNNY